MCLFPLCPSVSLLAVPSSSQYQPSQSCPANAVYVSLNPFSIAFQRFIQAATVPVNFAHLAITLSPCKWAPSCLSAHLFFPSLLYRSVKFFSLALSLLWHLCIICPQNKSLSILYTAHSSSLSTLPLTKGIYIDSIYGICCIIHMLVIFTYKIYGHTISHNTSDVDQCGNTILSFFCHCHHSL